MRSRHIVFVHGLFGWGPDEMFGSPYWGEGLKVVLDQLKSHGCSDTRVHEASCGPVSSFHDRACEVFAQIHGTLVDYGEDHCAQEQHRQNGKDYSGRGFFSGSESWSEDNSVVLIAHSAGAHTCLQLQQLLAEDFWHCGSTANWVEAVICISGVLNGSTLAYSFGCDKKSGKLTGPIGGFIGTGVQILGGLERGVARDIYDWDLDQWIDKTQISGIDDFIKALEHSKFAEGTDNLAYEMTLQGCKRANDRFETNAETYYFSVVTEQTSSAWVTSRQIPTPLLMNPVLWSSAVYQAVLINFDNQNKPLETWGNGDLTIAKWRENDGAVSSVSQRYPFTGGNHPIGGEGIMNRQNLQKGKWYYEKAESITGKSFDHLDVVFGYKTNPNLANAHRMLYSKLCDLICRLP